MRNKYFFVLLTALLILTACGTSETEAPQATQPPQAPQASATEPSQPSAAEEPVEVIWYVRTGEEENVWEQEVAIPEFEATHPNIKINLVMVGWDDFDTKMQALIAAGTPPDIWSHWGPSGFADYVARGLVADLTPLIENDDFDTSDFVPEVLDIYAKDGKIYALPMLTTASFVFYNKDMFDAAGVEYPPTDWDDTSWTWDAFLEKCEQLTNDTGDLETMTFGCHMRLWPADAYAWMFGQDLYPPDAYKTGFADEAYLDSEAAIKGYQALQDLVWKHHYMPDPAQTDALSAAGGLFEGGKVAMYMTGGWGWWVYAGLEEEFNWGVAALPYTDPNRRAVIFTDPWMMSSQSKHPQEAWEFLKFLASPEMQRSWMELTGAPPARQSLAEDWYMQFPSMSPEEVKQVHLGGLSNGAESPNHLLVKYDNLLQVVSSAVDPITNGEAEAADVLPEANEKLEEVLRQVQAEHSQ